MQDILENFEFRNQIPRLPKADALGTLIEKLTSPDVNLSPAPVKHADGSVRSPGLDNHGMGSIFEELVRRFNEENNEEAGEHWTPRDAVWLMAKLVFLPVADELKSGTYLLYDGACGTGGMLTVAEETLGQLAAEHGKDVSTHLFGQEINAETYAICTADLLLKGEGEGADNIVGGPEHSTLANDALPSREFDFMLSNPPYGKSWKTDLERMGGKPGHPLQRRSDAAFFGGPEDVTARGNPCRAPAGCLVRREGRLESSGWMWSTSFPSPARTPSRSTMPTPFQSAKRLSTMRSRYASAFSVEQ